VLVHLHDVFWPHGYPAAWLRERRDWNESYFLFAFLSGNPSWEILLWTRGYGRARPDVIPERLASEAPGLYLAAEDSLGRAGLGVGPAR